jgi:hypothetical protein
MLKSFCQPALTPTRSTPSPRTSQYDKNKSHVHGIYFIL